MNKRPDFTAIFRALRHRNYRIFFTGQSISLIGTWMQQVALGWLVYRITGSALALGVVGFAGQLPTFLLAPLAGVVADRYDRYRILILTQSLALLQALILAILVMTHTIRLWEIVALSIFLGIINSFDMPIRQAFTVEMIERKEDLGNAIALNSSMVNGARLLGPSLAGILIAWLGEGVCFAVNAASYVAVLIALSFMKIAPKEHIPTGKKVLEDIREGFSYAFKSLPIRSILLLLALVSMMGVPYQVLMPVFIKDVFHHGPRALGFLMSMSGVGALTGALYLASRRTVRGLARVIALTAGAFGLAAAAFSFSRSIQLSMVIIAVAGFSIMVQMAAANTVLQSLVDEDKRGRIMSLYIMAFMGMTPFGSLLAGMLAHRIGAPHTLLIGGISCVVGALFFAYYLPAIRKEMRPIYIKKGIIPEVADGLQSAAQMDVFLEK
ncbi:MAG: MFS transporter [Candidatus Omnitrophota bacterium]